MSDFKKLKLAVQNQIESMEADGTFFVVDITKDELWDTYLNSFPEGTNPMFRERTEHDCNNCKHFIRRMGGVVTIRDNKLVSIWDKYATNEYPYDVVSNKLAQLVRSKPIKDIFLSPENKVGTDKNDTLLDSGVVETWNHLFYELKDEYVHNNPSKSIDSVKGDKRSAKEVFKRALDELTIDAGETILDLIAQNSLYRGEEHKTVVEEFVKCKKEYDEVVETERDNWAWAVSITTFISRVKNSAIGTLLVDLSDGMALDEAVTRFEKVVAPANYKRPKPVFTKKMVEQAQSKIKDLGYEDSLGRRHASLDDISVNDVMFINRYTKNETIGDMGVFNELVEEATTNPKTLSKVQEIGIDKFIKDILPTVSDIELLVENRHVPNLMSLVAPKNAEAKSMLKWNNNFSWSYNGDVADSDIRSTVQSMGGKVDGVLRYSIMWNENGDNESDLDAHCFEPAGAHIYHPSNGIVHSSSGMLDIDIIQPNGKVAVENIVYSDFDKMPTGEYLFRVHGYSIRNSAKSGFKAEIVFDGQTYSFEYEKPLRRGEFIDVATVRKTKDGFEFVESMNSTVSSKETWGLKTNTFVKVNSVMLSPNYWECGNQAGNKHHFFLMDDCKCETSPRGFYNEFLDNELNEHRKVFEALGGKMKVEPSENQLSGVGFSSTVDNDIIVRVNGKFKRTLRIKF